MLPRPLRLRRLLPTLLALAVAGTACVAPAPPAQPAQATQATQATQTAQTAQTAQAVQAAQAGQTAQAGQAAQAEQAAQAGQAAKTPQAAQSAPAAGEAGATQAEAAEVPQPVVLFVGGGSVAEELRLRAILDSLSDYARPRRRRASLDDASYALQLLYHAQGFPFVTVTVTSRDPPAAPDESGVPAATNPPAAQAAPAAAAVPGGGTAARAPSADGAAPAGQAADAAPADVPAGGEITFVIDEGPRTVLTSVSFAGNRAFSDQELAELFRDRERGLLAPGLRWYSTDAVNDAISTISAVYWSEGYLKAEVDPPVTTMSGDRQRATVAISLREGPAYRLRRTEFAGTRVFPEQDLQEQVADFLDRPYFPQVAFAARARLVEFYGARGYAEAAVDFEEVRDDGSGDVGLLFRITAGEKLSVSDIRVSGLERTDPDFLLARLAFGPGDTWSTAAQRESYEALHRSGLFDSISIQLQEGRQTAREVAVSVEERPPQEVYVEPGFGSYEQLRMTFGYRDRNVSGKGRILHAESSLSLLAQSALVGLTDPWFGKDVTADVSVFANHREEPSFTRSNLGVAATLDRLLSPRWQTQFGYLFRHSGISQVEVVDADVQDALESVDISSLSVSPIYDSRDDPFAPTTGTYWRTTLEYGGAVLGSELDFVRGGYTHSVFAPLGADDVFAASFRTGLIAPVGSTDTIPLQERYFNGGENTVRSFKEDELGPKDSHGNPIGGEAYSVLSGELRHALGGRWGAAFFVDVGNVQEKANEYFHFDNRGTAIGVGLRYMLPIGPVRLDLGVNPDPGEDDDNWVAHLSVGAPF